MTAHLDRCRVDLIAVLSVEGGGRACKQAGGQHRVGMPAPLPHLLRHAAVDMQALALEKQLVVVSVLPPTPAPPERPRLADLPPVNENPPPPDVLAPDAAPAPQPAAVNGPLANGGGRHCQLAAGV